MKTSKSNFLKFIFISFAKAFSLLSFTAFAFCASNANVNLQVTVAPSLSVSVGTGSYGLGTLSANVTYVSTGAIPITNDSSGRTEDFEISADTSGTSWAISNSTNGSDQFYMRAVLNSTQPAPGDFSVRFSTLSTSLTYMSTANVGGFSGQSGKSVTSGSSLSLWLLFGTPASTSYVTPQKIGVVITAADASQF